MELQLSTSATLMLSILMLAAIGMLWMGITILRRGDPARGDRRRGILMLICAAVMMGNVLIWTV